MTLQLSNDEGTSSTPLVLWDTYTSLTRLLSQVAGDNIPIKCCNVLHSFTIKSLAYTYIAVAFSSKNTLICLAIVSYFPYSHSLISSAHYHYFIVPTGRHIVHWKAVCQTLLLWSVLSGVCPGDNYLLGSLQTTRGELCWIGNCYCFYCTCIWYSLISYP